MNRTFDSATIPLHLDPTLSLLVKTSDEDLISGMRKQATPDDAVILFHRIKMFLINRKEVKKAYDVHEGFVIFDIDGEEFDFNRVTNGTIAYTVRRLNDAGYICEIREDGRNTKHLPGGGDVEPSVVMQPRRFIYFAIPT